ncbi:hypothetical protein VFPPC_15548 [Pochonia chlamydosporia 170]|uniref:Uncharacterized protein n=1 Tax=Pochonia chlamydosporia 170 TaxID=1380566 RepID=A0A179FX25_METCM|nr:hypothetical protein VFPPC_15548 [Pochonia chlamydosporia 170]OAQ70172.1 hypothetical protein VFPPC_15548 [Pochonia chlamydosporia 170]
MEHAHIQLCLQRCGVKLKNTLTTTSHQTEVTRSKGPLSDLITRGTMFPARTQSKPTWPASNNP